MKCDVCGKESNFEAEFTKMRRSFRSSHLTMCNDCWVNLWPHQPKTGFGLSSDGKQLLQTLSFGKKAMAEVQLAKRLHPECRLLERAARVLHADHSGLAR